MNVKKWHLSDICTEFNDKPQGSIAKQLRCDELLYYTFIIQSAGERIFLKLVNVWRRYRQKMADCFMHPIRLALLPSKTLISPDKLNNLLIVAMLIGRLM